METIPGSEYLVEMMFDAGPTTITGMGDIPLDWEKLLAYEVSTGSALDPWEYRVLIKMSHGYLEERTGGEDPLRISPLLRGISIDEIVSDE